MLYSTCAARIICFAPECDECENYVEPQPKYELSEDVKKMLEDTPF